jgi:RND family efflux transporter MFP subunit
MPTPVIRRILPFLLLLPLFAGCGGGKSTSQVVAGGPQAMPVAMQTVEPTQVQDSAEYVSTLKSRNSTTVSPQVEGVITKIFVKSGDHARAGQPLMQIDPLKQQATTESQQAALKSKEADTAYAEQQLNRTRQLYQAGVSSKQDYDQAQSAYDADVAQVNALKATLQEQNVQLKYYTVDSPASGIIGDVPVHVGDRVTTSTMLTTVDQPGALEAYIYVPVERGPDLALGKPVEILGDDGAKLGEGKITFISPEVDANTQTILVKSKVENPKGIMRTAETVRARVIFGSHAGVTVPVLSVTRLSGRFFVYVAEQGEKGMVCHQREIQVGDIQGNDYIVLGGLKPGDRLITSNTAMLADGMPVQPLPGPQKS